MAAFSSSLVRSELLFKGFGVLSKEILIGMSILSNKIFWKLLTLLSPTINLTESATYGRFSDLVDSN